MRCVGAAFVVLSGVSAAFETLPLHMSECDGTRVEQDFTYDDVTGYMSATLDGTAYCLVVEGCGLAQSAAVVLVPCGRTNVTCGSWSLRTPPHVETPDVQWLVAPGSPSDEPHCLENPLNGTLVNIYCCSGSSNCKATYPKAIPHQQWELPSRSKGLRVTTGKCLQAALPPVMDVPLWPLPAELRCTGGRVATLLSDSVDVLLADTTSAVAVAAAQRYGSLLRAAGSAEGSGTIVRVVLEHSTEELSLTTNYSYSVSLAPGSQIIEVEAVSPYGVAYALESLLQLADKRCDSLELRDAPVLNHRGLMVDTGRRFYPVPLLESLLEGMAMYKLNVLHFHLSEQCFRVESKLFPGLHAANCSRSGMSNDKFYTQDDVSHIVQFAQLRGIRVVPEFDMPGHSQGFCRGLASEGIRCCGSGEIYDDPEGRSVALINAVLDEMMVLFPDNVVHIGADEVGVGGDCTLETVRSFEEKVIQHLLGKNKTVMGWEEVLFASGAARVSQDVVVDAWHHFSWEQVAQQGHPSVVSDNHHFYLDSTAELPTYQWLDISTGVANKSLQALLLGGETSMWQNEYLAGNKAGCLFQSPERDDDFSNSTSSLIWPRAAIAAGSFWRYSSRLSAADNLFASVLEKVGARLRARGVGACACTTPLLIGCESDMYCGQAWCSADEGIEFPVV